MAVFLIQISCPNRHLLGVEAIETPPFVPEEEASRQAAFGSLHELIDSLAGRGYKRGFCPVCAAQERRWIVDTYSMDNCKTLDDAMPLLEELSPALGPFRRDKPTIQ